MSFQESYLVPKELFEATVRRRPGEKFARQAMPARALLEKTPPLGMPKPSSSDHLPDDVKLKVLDYQKRFLSSKPPKKELKETLRDIVVKGKAEQKRLREIGEILDNVVDPSKKNLAANILKFITKNSGGKIKWDDKFNLVINDQVVQGNDIRDAVRNLIGEISDPLNKNMILVRAMKDLGARPNLLMYRKKSAVPEKAFLGKKRAYYSTDESSDEEISFPRRRRRVAKSAPSFWLVGDSESNKPIGLFKKEGETSPAGSLTMETGEERPQYASPSLREKSTSSDEEKESDEHREESERSESVPLREVEDEVDKIGSARSAHSMTLRSKKKKWANLFSN